MTSQSDQKTTPRQRAEEACAMALSSAHTALSMIAALPDPAASAAARAALADMKEIASRGR